MTEMEVNKEELARNVLTMSRIYPGLVVVAAVLLIELFHCWLHECGRFAQ